MISRPLPDVVFDFARAVALDLEPGMTPEQIAAADADLGTTTLTREGSFQQSNLLPSLTVLDQLLLTVHLRGTTPGAADRDRAVHIADGRLKEVEVSHAAH